MPPMFSSLSDTEDEAEGEVRRWRTDKLPIDVWALGEKRAKRVVGGGSEAAAARDNPGLQRGCATPLL